MAADNQDQGYVPLYRPPGQKPTAAPPPSAAPLPQTQVAPATNPNDQGYVPLYQKPGSGQQTGGGQQASSQPWTLNPQTWNVPLPQPVQDWGNIAGNEAVMGGLPGLKAQADAARQRLGPLAAGSADVVGSALSPTSLLNVLPGGPLVAGATHEWLKGALAGNDLKTTAEDAGVGALTGLVGLGAAKAAPVVAPLAARFGVTAGGPMATTGASHLLFGHGDLSRELMGAAGSMGLLPGWNEAGKAVQGGAKDALSSPAAQQAIKSLVLGGGSAARNYAGPWDQWIPGQ